METLWITFRISEKTVSSRDYDERYQALVEAVNTHANDAWDEPTSFWMVQTTSTRAAVAASVKKAIATSTDLVLIGSMDNKGATLVGKSDKADRLKRLVPDAVIA